MNLHWENHSTVVTDAQVRTMVMACRWQLSHHLCPAWGLRAPYWQNTGGFPIVILDNADQAEALGYHDVDPNGRPYARVFAKTVLDAGGTVDVGPLSVSAVLSHELCELVVDPDANEWRDYKQGEVAAEACDPCEDQAYEVLNISVSNFVLPAWFSGAPGPYDYMRQLSEPGELSSGGYLILRQTGRVAQQFGSTDARLKLLSPLKTHPASRTYRRIHSLPAGDTTVEVFKDAEGGWRWHAKAANGEIIAQGESYTRKADAHRGAARAFPDAPIEVTPVNRARPGGDGGSAQVHPAAVRAGRIR